MTVRGPMVRIALLEDTDRSKTRRRTTFGRARTEFAPFGMRASYDAKHRVDRRSYIQVLLPIDFTFGKGGTVMGWEIGLKEGRFRLVQWMPQSNI